MIKDEKELQAYLAKIRKTIEASKRAVSQAELRIAETDRMLEQQGLTREQVMSMRFSDAQMEAVNAELKRRGLTPMEKWSMEPAERLAAAGGGWRDPRDESGDSGLASPDDALSDSELENRQRKFGMMMKPFQI